MSESEDKDDDEAIETTPIEGVKTRKEELLALRKKIQELRMKKLLTIEHITDETEGLEGKYKQLDKELGEIKSNFKEGKVSVKDVYALVTIIKAQQDTVQAHKTALREQRLALTLLIKEEGKIAFEILKLSKGIGS